MTTFTIQNDHAVRAHLSGLAKEIRAKFPNTVHQGDYVDTITNKTYGDRLQVGTQRTIQSIRYLFVANIDIDRNSGGQVSVRVTTWAIDASTGLPVGHHTIRKTPMSGVKLTQHGFRERIGNTYQSPDIARRIAGQINLAETLLGSGFAGRTVKDTHTRQDGSDLYTTYDTHLLAFGGVVGAGARLIK